jgi:hypothetical protein
MWHRLRQLAGEDCKLKHWGAATASRRTREGASDAAEDDLEPECTYSTLEAWVNRHGGQLACSRPGPPTDDPFTGAFQGWIREACCNQPRFIARGEPRTKRSGPTRHCIARRQPPIQRSRFSTRRFKPSVTPLPDGQKMGAYQDHTRYGSVMRTCHGTRARFVLPVHGRERAS